MKAKARNTIGWVLIITGLILAFGAVGESDIYGEMGKFLPLVVTIKKVILGFGAIFLGMVIKED